MKLYYEGRTAAVAPAIALLEAGLDHDLYHVNFKTVDQSKPAYLAINSKGLVPALELNDGTVLTESGAILEYIAALAPDAKLIPTDPLDAAYMRSVMYYVAATMHVAHTHKQRFHRWADKPESHQDMIAKVPETMAACAAYVDTQGLRGDYVCGDAFTLADAMLFFVCNLLDNDGVTVSDYPTVSAYMERMESRDSVKTLRAKGMLDVIPGL